MAGHEINSVETHKNVFFDCAQTNTHSVKVTYYTAHLGCML